MFFSLSAGADVGRWNGAAFANSDSIYGAVGQEAGAVVVNHVKVAGLALGRRIVRQRFQVIQDGFDAVLRGIAALGEVAIEIDVHGVLVV